jgi:two-component system cell cycle sensor histidine kinase/response regulator CckA
MMRIEELAVSENERSLDDLTFDAPLGSELVLVVDDEPLVLRLCCSILERQGYQVFSAGSAQEALRYCQNGGPQPNLLLSDVIMPKIKGTDLAERVWKIYPEMRVLYMSGFDGREIPEYDILRSGAKLIPKPFTPRELLVAVRAALDNPGGM